MKYFRRLLSSTALALALTTSVALATEPAGSPAVVTGNYPAINLLETTQDVLGRPLSYPDCPPSIHSVIITMAPGQVGKEHQHLTPLYAYILSGELSVDYATGVTKVYKAGDALMEAMHVQHHGYNPTDKPVKLLAVYMNCAK